MTPGDAPPPIPTRRMPRQNTPETEGRDCLSDGPSPLTGRGGVRVELKHKLFCVKQRTKFDLNVVSTFKCTLDNFSDYDQPCSLHAVDIIIVFTGVCLPPHNCVAQYSHFKKWVFQVLLTLRERHTLNFNLLDAYNS